MVGKLKAAQEKLYHGTATKIQMKGKERYALFMYSLFNDSLSKSDYRGYIIE
jgi:hypothetical protein